MAIFSSWRLLNATLQTALETQNFTVERRRKIKEKKREKNKRGVHTGKSRKCECLQSAEGFGYGHHAERCALKRPQRDRNKGGTLNKNGKPSTPCPWTILNNIQDGGQRLVAKLKARSGTTVLTWGHSY